MIPSFNAEGNLPPGIHICTWEEFVERYGITPHRSNLITGLRMAMEHLREAGCSMIYIDGSFVTNKQTPGDFDACWQTEGVDIEKLVALASALLKFENKRAAQKAMYGGELFPAGVSADNAGTLFLDFFQVTRNGKPKGIIAIDLARWQP